MSNGAYLEASTATVNGSPMIGSNFPGGVAIDEYGSYASFGPDGGTIAYGSVYAVSPSTSGTLLGINNLSTGGHELVLLTAGSGGINGLVAGEGEFLDVSTGQILYWWDASGSFTFSGLIGFTPGMAFMAEAPVVGFAPNAPKVMRISDGGNNANGWLQWAGQTRVTSVVNFNNTTTLGTVTGLSVNVQAGRTYGFEADLSFTCTPAQGIRIAIGGTCTATAIVYDGWIVDSGANGIKGNAQSTALAGVVANAARGSVTSYINGLPHDWFTAALVSAT